MNPAKSELINVNLQEPAFNTAYTSIDSLLGGVRVTETSDVEILGSPFHPSRSEELSLTEKQYI